MKLLLLIVALIAVFTANGQDFPNGGSKEPDPTDNTYFTVEDQDIANDLEDLGFEPEVQSSDEDGYELNKIGDISMVLERSRWCTSRGGRCRSRKHSCGSQESPFGKPYCTSRKKRCCYPGSSPWVKIQSQYYRLVGPIGGYNGLNWTSARKSCQDLGGDLAQPKSVQALASYLFNIHHTFFWLGANNAHQYLDGSKVSGFHGQPANAHDCVAIHPVYCANSLFTKPCNTTQHMKLVCEKPLH